ncbi:16836_t:CDS:2 [Racocetra persica]|uniref:16836_t:CDS:1 n=1 Tax=Racocetra persica TaxID=160502 RepID=A0ACA9LS26_9GLOM|nr:16836_t:CDS:2 [Racocetra persica]
MPKLSNSVRKASVFGHHVRNHTDLIIVIFDGGNIVPRPLPPPEEFDINNGGRPNF